MTGSFDRFVLWPIGTRTLCSGCLVLVAKPIALCTRYSLDGEQSGGHASFFIGPGCEYCVAWRICKCLEEQQRLPGRFRDREASTVFKACRIDDRGIDEEAKSVISDNLRELVRARRAELRAERA